MPQTDFINGAGFAIIMLLGIKVKVSLTFRILGFTLFCI
jgi:hypothetical protein